MGLRETASYWWLCAATLALTPSHVRAQSADTLTGPATDAGASAVPLATGPAVAAAPGTPAGATVVISYQPDYFTRYAPRSALDMVRNVPDFRLTGVSGDRGIGQASQNVLINGARVSGKSNDAETELERIAAGAVTRIDIIDGATLGIPGLSGRVANVVVASSGLGVQFRWSPQFRQNVEYQLFTGSVSANGRIGASEVSLSLSNDNGLRRAGVGPEFGFLGDGTLAQIRNERAAFYGDAPRLAGSLRRSWGNGDILNLNLSGQSNLVRSNIAADGFPQDGRPRFSDLIQQREHGQSLEGGGDFEFNLAGGRLKLIGLQGYTHSTSLTRFDTVPVSGAPSGLVIDRASDAGESVGRAEFSWADGNWQVAIEGAYNFLDTDARIGFRAADGSYPLGPLPGGSIFVDEWRADSSVSHNVQLATGLTIQATLGAEYSQIRYSGGGRTDVRNFLRPKGTVSLTWAAARRLTVNARLQRRVGQLNFGDFAANVDVQNNVSSATNSDLVPEQAWRFEASVIRSLGPSGSLTLGGYAEVISDIVDRIPLTATTEGVGNLPSASRWGVTVAGTLLLDAIGWHGGRIDARGEFSESNVRDPVTGQIRSISNDVERDWSLQLRHDIPRSQLAWGFEMFEDRNVATFRLDQTFRQTLTNAVTQVYIEHKNVGGLTVRLSLRNLLGARDNIARDYYVARRDGPLAYYEQQLREIDLIGLLTVSGNF